MDISGFGPTDEWGTIKCVLQILWYLKMFYDSGTGVTERYDELLIVYFVYISNMYILYWMLWIISYVQVIEAGDGATRVVWPFRFSPQQPSVESVTPLISERVTGYIKDLELLAQK